MSVAPGELRQSCYLQSGGTGTPGNHCVIVLRLQPADGSHAGRCHWHLEPAGETGLRRFDEDLASLRVHLAHVTDVMTEVSFKDELGKNSLLERRRMPVGNVSSGRESLHQTLGKDDESQPQRREQHLGKGTYIDDASAFIQLVKLRASQINGCAFCIDMHTKDARADGETEQRLYALNAWRETPFFTDRERAALAWCEALTLVSETRVPDDVYEQTRERFSELELVNLTMAIVVINGWNRICVGFRTCRVRTIRRLCAAEIRGSKSTWAGRTSVGVFLPNAQ